VNEKGKKKNQKVKATMNVLEKPRGIGKTFSFFLLTF